jgi:hypothetical protein
MTNLKKHILRSLKYRFPSLFTWVTSTNIPNPRIAREIFNRPRNRFNSAVISDVLSTKWLNTLDYYHILLKNTSNLTFIRPNPQIIKGNIRRITIFVTKSKPRLPRQRITRAACTEKGNKVENFKVDKN